MGRTEAGQLKFTGKKGGNTMVQLRAIAIYTWRNQSHTLVQAYREAKPSKAKGGIKTKGWWGWEREREGSRQAEISKQEARNRSRVEDGSAEMR